jgi:hypothetical protein
LSCFAFGALAACGTLSAPPAEQTLGANPVADTATADLDQRTQQALAAVAQFPDDVAALVEASRFLFLAADRRLQQATVAWLAAHPAVARAEVLVADDQLGDDVRTGIASLCTRGLEFADRAAALAPNDVRARLHQALHLSLLAWANGPARSLFAGYGPKLVAAIDAAVAIDPAHDGAAPLRLSGRFRSKAPWPYGDLAAAEKSLLRAVELAPGIVNHLFCGDVLQLRDRPDAAEVQWRAAVAAAADDGTRWSVAPLRALAQARLASRR